MSYYLLKAISRLVCLLPAGLRLLIGDGIGALCWPLVPQKRKEMAVGNAMAALEIDRGTATGIVKASAVRFGRMMLEVLSFPLLNRDNIHQHVTMVGSEHLWDACKYGRGVILATSHCGNWEMLGAALALNGFPIVGVSQKQTNPAMDRFIVEYRTMVGIHVTYKTGIREMIALMGDGKIIGLLMDQDAQELGAFVEFFGRPASTPQGAAALARLKDAPIVPTFITQNADGTHTATIHPMVWVTKTADRDDDLFRTTQELTAVVERHIRQHPQEWFWLHNRWKSKPPPSRS